MTDNRFVWQPGDVTITKLDKVVKVKLSRYGTRRPDPGEVRLFNHNHGEGGRFDFGTGTDIRGQHPQRGSSTSPGYLAAQERVVPAQAKAVADGQDTETLYDKVDGHTGAYTPERTRQQMEIVNETLAGKRQPLGEDGKPTPISANRQMLFMGGLPGAGKTTWLNNADNVARLGVNPKSFITLNPDDVKEIMQEKGMYPDYQTKYGLAPNEVPALVHEESGHITGMIAAAAESRGLNVAWDVTMRPGQFEKKAVNELAENTKTAGGVDYHTTAIYIDTEPGVARDQAAGRYLGGGRFLPMQNIPLTVDADGKTENRSAFDKVSTSPDVDRSILVQNREVVYDSADPKLSDPSRLKAGK